MAIEEMQERSSVAHNSERGATTCQVLWVKERGNEGLKESWRCSLVSPRPGLKPRVVPSSRPGTDFFRTY